MDYTLVKISRARRNELEQVWLQMQISEGKRLNLQEVVDRVLETGILQTIDTGQHSSMAQANLS